MSVETPSLFTQIIQEHLELKRRNAGLNTSMPMVLNGKTDNCPIGPVDPKGPNRPYGVSTI